MIGQHQTEQEVHLTMDHRAPKRRSESQKVESKIDQPEFKHKGLGRKWKLLENRGKRYVKVTKFEDELAVAQLWQYLWS